MIRFVRVVATSSRLPRGERRHQRLSTLPTIARGCGCCGFTAAQGGLSRGYGVPVGRSGGRRDSDPPPCPNARRPRSLTAALPVSVPASVRVSRGGAAARGCQAPPVNAPAARRPWAPAEGVSRGRWVEDSKFEFRNRSGLALANRRPRAHLVGDGFVGPDLDLAHEHGVFDPRSRLYHCALGED